MAATDVSGTRDTTGVVGTPTAPVISNTQQNASIKETEGTTNRNAASTPPAAAAGTYNPPQPLTVTSTNPQPDTAAVQGETAAIAAAPETYRVGAVTGTLETTVGGGSTIQHKVPAYRAPADFPGATVRDTTLTDKRTSDGLPRNDIVGSMTGTTDTVNFQAPLQTTTTNLPAAPAGAPTVLGVNRGVQVTITPVADPAGAKVRGYHVEGSTYGVDWIPANQTSIVVGNLVPSQSYKFRYAAINDNGLGPFSPFSAAAVPLHPDEAGPGRATNVTTDNQVNPIYNPDGTTTGPNPVATLGAAATANVGELKVDWTAPVAKTPAVPVTGYKITLSNGATKQVGAVLTWTFTAQPSNVPVTAMVVPLSAKGQGVATISNSAIPK
jgi:hypothetical protein